MCTAIVGRRHGVGGAAAADDAAESNYLLTAGIGCAENTAHVAAIVLQDGMNGRALNARNLLFSRKNS